MTLTGIGASRMMTCPVTSEMLSMVPSIGARACDLNSPNKPLVSPMISFLSDRLSLTFEHVVSDIFGGDTQ